MISRGAVAQSGSSSSLTHIVSVTVPSRVKVRVASFAPTFVSAVDAGSLAPSTQGLSLNVTATQASLTGMLEPIANPLWVFLLLGERPSGFAIAGAAVVLCAIGWHALGGAPAADLPAVD